MRKISVLFQLAWRDFIGRHQRLSSTSWLAMFGMALGVACLVVAMAVVSGYETTLKKSVIDFVGDILVIRRGGSTSNQTLASELQNQIPQIQKTTPFVIIDAALVHSGKLNGVIIHGVDPETVNEVLNLKDRMKEGSLDFPGPDQNTAVVGKEIASRFGLKIGDEFKVVLPLPSEKSANGFVPKAKSFRLVGVIDVGRHDFDSRYILVHIKQSQELAQMGDRVSGFRLKLKDSDDAEKVAYEINHNMEIPYHARSWLDINYNLFKAVKIEKTLIFSVLLIMIFAACFNISTHLFIHVIRKFKDMSIMRTLGSSQREMAIFFSFQGLIVGAAGVLMGIILGMLISQGFVWAQNKFGLISGEVYKLSHINVEWRFLDLLVIVTVSLVICFLFSWVPAWRGSKMQPTEGLRYE